LDVGAAVVLLPYCHFPAMRHRLTLGPQSIWRRVPPLQEVDLVLLDIVMPVMDGVELLTILQADAALRHIPVVMLSGLEDRILAEVCIDSGATAVCLKPLDSDQVQHLITSRGIAPRQQRR
jgi:CheY-like chemotaxis protein